ncbi:hypothetical protein CBOM_05966 [Ceraceosorus bombacis]|uniref:Uncharacterized protein n=1 Tax=Ceraceosorus bombacis TaxID=401625 RepID=A0A0P1BK29_9BASI|nr:hypothetical protein CBOM_05966 [Ceraceosorus bombacis]
MLSADALARTVALTVPTRANPDIFEVTVSLQLRRAAARQFVNRVRSLNSQGVD